MVSGSAPLPKSLARRWQTVSGHELLERYGMTEIGMALSNPLRGERLLGHVGQPLAGVQVEIRRESGEGSVEGPGMLYVRGPSVFREYWRNSEATAAEIDEEGWFRTGDIAALSPRGHGPGYYRILGRASADLIKTAGHKVSALDVEVCLLEHPEIHEVAVVGFADTTWGEVVSAVVVMEDKHAPPLQLEMLRVWVEEQGGLASHEVPRRLWCVPAIPRNAMGKVNKRTLLADLGLVP